MSTTEGLTDKQKAKQVARRLKGHKPKERNIIRVNCVMDVELGDSWHTQNTARIEKNILRAFSTNERNLVALKHRVVAKAVKNHKTGCHVWPHPMPAITDQDRV